MSTPPVAGGLVRKVELVLILLVTAAVAAAAAQGPEQVDQLEPGAGDPQAEYSATAGRDGGGRACGRGGVRLVRRLALGFEVEADYEGSRLAFETLGPELLYRITRDDAPVAMAFRSSSDSTPRQAHPLAFRCRGRCRDRAVTRPGDT